MGSQTLEILRQGVWASITGGWFYDPHQNVFCNTVHLYIWLFLLCLPFTIYLYFPPTVYGWCVYCGLVSVMFVCVKVLNYALHHMYDTSGCIIVPLDNTAPPEKRRMQKKHRDEEDFELQVLSRTRTSTTHHSDNESVDSAIFGKPNSTIDLKVDVHRKNSSESSNEEGGAVGGSAPPQRGRTRPGRASLPPIHPRWSKLRVQTAQSLDRGSQEALRMEICSKTEDAVAINIDQDTDDFSSVPHNSPVVLRNANFPNAEQYLSKFARQLSSDCRENCGMVFGAGPASKRNCTVYPPENYTKSVSALPQPSHSGQASGMRRNSNSTMSTIQLPLVSSTAQLVAHVRRHSNVDNTSLGFLPTGSVELGAYMMEKSNKDSGGGNNSSGDGRSGVRRIKSAALEIGCLPPSVSNLSPHPNSVEAIGGQVLKNPKSAIIPPPSKSLIRNPHLNLWPKPGSSGDANSLPYMNYGSEIVYPIAEISDEMQTSQCQESDLESLSSHCDSDYDDDHPISMKYQHNRVFETDFHTPRDVNSSDTEFENNGSRSPLLDRNDCLNDVKIVKTKSSDKSDMEHKKHMNSASKHNSDKNKCDRSNNSISSKNIYYNSGTPARKESEEAGGSRNHSDFVNNKQYDCRIGDNSEHTPAKQRNANNKIKTFDPGDYFDQTSASSKDFLLEKSSVDSNECLLDNFQKHKQKLELEVEEVKKPPDRETSNSSGSLEMQDARQEVATETSDISDPKTSDTQSKDTSPPLPKSETDSKLQSDENSLYGITWLFEEATSCQDEQKENVEENNTAVESVLKSPKPSCSNAESGVTVSQRNLGAIPKQIKNLSRTRHSSLKENKKKDRHRPPAGPTQEELDTAEAHSAFVQGLECLFAATNANTVVMPPLNREERLRSSQWQADPPSRRDSQKPKKKSIEEMAQISTNTILPTSMPLLAAFLNSRVEYPHIPIFSPETADPDLPEGRSATGDGVQYEFHRTKPLMDRNHRNRTRKIKKSTRQRSLEQTTQSSNSNNSSNDKTKEEGKGDMPNTSSSNVHIATSFEDTTDGAIHCFMDEYGNWMSYTFDKNSSGLPKEAVKTSQNTKSADTVEATTTSHQDNTVLDGSCGSITSDLTGHVEVSGKRGDENSTEQGATNGSIYNSSSNQGSNNPLLSSNNNSTSMLPISQANNSRSKTIYVMEPAVQPPQRRSPAAILTETILERSDRISPNAHSSCLFNAAVIPGSSGFNMPLFQVSIDSDAAKKRFIDSIETTEENHPKSYYKLKIFKCWKIKVTMDRLKLMALFDRNLTLTETFLSIFLGIMVSVLGALILHMGFYRDVYAFWFCFVMAGSQYSLLKSVQPDSASPVHGFNRMVAFSRPVYFCLCAAILCIVHHTLDSYEGTVNTSEQLTLYGFRVRPKETLEVIEHVISTLLLFFPLAFSLGLFPQVNTFAMYLFEQIDMHIFGGNGTASLSASIYCVFRSLMAVAVLYGFAYGGLTESKGSQHILFSMFCGLVIPISYHLSRSASDYAMVWNLIKNHLIPADLYNIHSTENSDLELEKQQNTETSNERTQGNNTNKHHSESNISKQPSIGSSTSKVNFSSEANVSKSQKRSQTSVNSSVNSLKGDSTLGAAMNSSGSIKTETQGDDGGKSSKLKASSEETAEGEMEDPLPKKLQETVNGRFKNDIIVCSFMAVFIFGIHCTTVFSILQPELNPVVWSISALLGWVLHYLTPQLRKQLPWLWLASPLLKPREHAQFEVREPARVMWFEKAYVYLCFLERNILYPVVFISAVTQDSPSIILKFGPGIGSLIVCICALKGVRNAYSDPDSQYLILVFGVLLFRLDYSWASETFLVDYFIMAIIFNKMYEFLLKIQFVVTYIAPWQITWGSAFHAFAQPFSVPHSAMLFLQAAISAILSTPLNPILGSAIFMSSYVRPVKFWERDYNTKRVDQSNTRLSSQLERNLGSDDNNLNSIFYEHLTRSLQHYLCGDLLLGRWGQVQQGDCFVLASDYLNCLVHIVEMGNGLVSFQLRGLEFRGTYCQQREVEAISEGPEDNDGCCCCSVGHLPGMLSVNAMFSLRWLAWQVVTARYVLEGYSITDNSAASMLQMFDFRKVLITYYVKSIIFYTINSPKLEEWLASASILEALKPTLDKNFIDLDPIFNLNLDEDYDFRSSGITRASFCAVYHDWVSYCGMKREDLYKQKGDKFVARDSALVSLCFGLSLVGRRSLGAASHNTVSSVEFFLYGLHALFKGDFRITCVRDEWVFSDVSLLHSVLAPAVRMALKLHQDHFMSPEEYCSCPILYSAITCHSTMLVICHEASSTWRNNVLRGAPHLLALRHVMDDGNDEYKIIMLNKRPLSFRVIKLNRECVRGLWAGQQQELIYLRNRNPERGSIQNAKQALRNIINSSCDQPIGYPIYVSPLTTSYMDTNSQVTSLVGGALTLSTIKKHTLSLWRKMRRRCGEGCSSGSGSNGIECGISTTISHPNQTPHHTLDLSRTSLAGTRGSLASVGKPGSSTLASLAGLLGSREQQSAPDLPITGAARLFFEKQEAEQTCTTIKEAGEPRTSGTSEKDQEGSTRDAERGHTCREGRQAIPLPSVEGIEVVRRSKDRKRPGSVKLGAYQEQGPPGRKRRPARTNKNKKSKASTSSPSHPISIPSRDSSSDDLSSVPVGLTIANRGANLKLSSYLDQPRDSHRRRSSDFAGSSSRDFMCKQHTSEKNIDNITSKDISLRNIESSSEHSVLKRSSESPRELAKTTKDLRHDRESYRDLAGKYSELSMKETGLRIAGDPKDPNRKAIVKRSESLKTELKSHISIGCKVVITDPSGVYDCINLGRRIDVTWPSAFHRQRGGRNSWGNWVPQHGMDGQVVHRWTPNHRDPSLRSHVDKTILLVQIGDRFVPIAENCVQDLGDEV